MNQGLFVTFDKVPRYSSSGG